MLPFLLMAHIAIIVSANYLTQYPFELFGFHTTYGAFTFPFIFLITDLTVRLLGAWTARKVIFLVMIPVVFISYAVSSMFFRGEFQGLAGFTELNWFVLRIALASFAAYAFGQLLDISIFNKLRERAEWWVAPAASMTFGNLIDSLLFFGVAFAYSEDPFMSQHWLDIALFDTVFKVGISLLFLIPAYGVVVRRVLGTRTARYYA